MSNKKKRPLIDKESPKAELIKLYAKRKDAYKMADHKIDCSKYTKNEIIKQILKVYEKVEIKSKNSSNNYSILIGDGVTNDLPKRIKITCPKTKKIAIISDKKCT